MRWKTFTRLFQKLCTKFHENCPSFTEDITKNIFGLFFRTRCIVLLFFQKTDPPPSFHYSTCRTLCGHVSNSWAPVFPHLPTHLIAAVVNMLTENAIICVTSVTKLQFYTHLHNDTHQRASNEKVESWAISDIGANCSRSRLYICLVSSMSQDHLSSLAIINIESDSDLTAVLNADNIVSVLLMINTYRLNLHCCWLPA